MIRFRNALALLSLCSLVTVGSLRAQSPLRVTIAEPDRVLDATDRTLFLIRVDNVSSSDVRLHVVREVNRYPDAGWFSDICVPGTCYAPEVDSIAPFLIRAGEATGISVHVYAGAPGTAHLRFRFDAGDGTGSVMQDLSVQFGDVAGVTAEPAAGLLLPYPNPVSSKLTIPIPDDHAPGLAARSSLGLYSASGELVVDLDGALRSAIAGGERAVSVDATGLANGVYIYRIGAGEKVISGSIVVVHR